MTRICVLLIAVLAAMAAMAQQIRFDLLPRELIEQRLQDFDRDDTKREQELKQLFAAAGCKQITEQPVKGLKQPNLMCTLPGKTAQTIIVGAHFDHVNAGQGVVDNWSGASLLPSLLQSLMDQPRHHTYLFIGFSGEEHGLIGSRFFVSHVTREERASMAAMINLDTLGLGPTEVWSSHADPALLQDLSRVANTLKLPVSGMNVDGVGTADSEAFASLKVPRMTIHSVTSKTLHVLHSSDDNLKSVSLGDYYDSYHLIAGFLALLDNALPVAAPPAANGGQAPQP